MNFLEDRVLPHQDSVTSKIASLVSPRVASKVLCITLALAFLAGPALAGSFSCPSTIKRIVVFERAAYEGAVTAVVRVDGDAQDRAWILCNLNADKGTSMTGQDLIAANDQHPTTCQANLNLLTVAAATGKKVNIHFTDYQMSECANVPSWGGIPDGDGDDPGGRLGAWDGFYRLELTNLDAD